MAIVGVITLVGSGTRAAIIGLVVGLGAAILMAGCRSRWQRRTLAFGVTPPEGICVEPQTMWPNAPVLASLGVADTGLRVLEIGERTQSRQRWTWAARSSSPTRLR